MACPAPELNSNTSRAHSGTGNTGCQSRAPHRHRAGGRPIRRQPGWARRHQLGQFQHRLVCTGNVGTAPGYRQRRPATRHRQHRHRKQRHHNTGFAPNAGPPALANPGKSPHTRPAGSTSAPSTPGIANHGHRRRQRRRLRHRRVHHRRMNNGLLLARRPAVFPVGDLYHHRPAALGCYPALTSLTGERTNSSDLAMLPCASEASHRQLVNRLGPKPAGTPIEIDRPL